MCCGHNFQYIEGRLWQKTCIEVICCYVSHHPTVLSPLSHLPCDNQKLVYFLVNSSCLCVLSCKFISRITLTFRFNLTHHAEYIVLCGASHLVIYYLRYHRCLVFHLPYHICCWFQSPMSHSFICCFLVQILVIGISPCHQTHVIPQIIFL
jgi:hypothetical protein